MNHQKIALYDDYVVMYESDFDIAVTKDPKTFDNTISYPQFYNSLEAI